jgi:hypothetical protein
MRNTRIVFLLAIVSIVVWSAHSDDVSELRAGGQASVDQLYAQLEKAPAAERANLETRLDRVCAQKDCSASRLFWYTDLDEAKAAARRLHRPILALHMLGRLDEELSCANSRFFRTLLYSDDSISNILRERYVLYWHSVRPVPRVTIEMGDGRVIHQTITGNSVHYLLDENGKVLDALPGLYSPAVFRNELQRWLELNRSLDRGADLRSHHAAFGPAVRVEPTRKPTAIDASRLTFSKMVMERPLLVQTQTLTTARIAALRTAGRWVKIGEWRKDQVQFSPAAIELIRRKQFGNADVAPNVLRDLLDNLRRNVAADTAFNEETLRPRIHQWFANGEVLDLDSLNERVYRELFLTPSDDPWLGLQPASVFAAIGGQS